MLFPRATAMTLIASLLGVQVQAAPSAKKGIQTFDEPVLTILKTETFGDYKINLYEDKTSPPPLDQPAAESCGSRHLSCSTNYQADKELCSILASYLRSYENVEAPTSGRAVCASQSGQSCCASWSAHSPGLLYGHLLPAVQQTRENCNTRGNMVSGLVHNADLAGSCLKQCLSNRAEGCS